MSLSFPETYDELAILAHHGADDEELARRLTEREAMSELGRFHADTQARSHCGPTLADHRARWAREDPAAWPPHQAVAAEANETVGPTLLARSDELYDQALAAFAAAKDVPTGPMADVLAWVGDDQVRARAAIEAESIRPDPRTSLLAKLGRIADG